MCMCSREGRNPGSPSDIWRRRGWPEGSAGEPIAGEKAVLKVTFLNPVSPFGMGNSLHLDRGSDTNLTCTSWILSAPEVFADASWRNWGSWWQIAEGLQEVSRHPLIRETTQVLHAKMQLAWTDCTVTRSLQHPPGTFLIKQSYPYPHSHSYCGTEPYPS